MLPNLEALWLNENARLSGSTPAVLGMQQLWLRNCSLAREIPSSLGNLTELESLDLPINHLPGHIPTSLTRLYKATELYQLRSIHLLY